VIKNNLPPAMNLSTIVKKFQSAFCIQQDEELYVNGARVNDHFKRKVQKGANLKALIAALANGDTQVDFIIRKRRSQEVLDIALTDFKPNAMDLFVNVRHIQSHERLLQVIEELPDVNTDTYHIAEPSAQEVTPTKARTSEPPIIELEEHERFLDVNGEPVDIEVRGERSQDGLLFKAKDVAAHFEMDNLIDILLRAQRSHYEHMVDFIIIGISQTTQGCIGDPTNESTQGDIGISQTTLGGIGHSTKKTIAGISEGNNVPIGNPKRIDHDCIAGISEPVINRDWNPKRIDHDKVFLTLAGFIRVVCVSRSGNANVAHTFKWIQSLVYVHKFGSQEERQVLSQDLLKVFLNDALSCLYYIDLGTFNELYEKMGISKETYPHKL